MFARIAAWSDKLRGSLFFVPMMCVVFAIVMGEAMLVVDSQVTEIHPRLTATVDSARTVLTTVAGATLTFAGIAFSVSLLLISLASSQYSPRVVHGMFRDPFNKRVMGLVVGTFTYCLVVLRAVRSSLEGVGEAIVPSVSILLAVVLGIASILSIIAFINHAAHSMDVSMILHRVTHEALSQASSAWPEPSQDDDQGESDGPVPDLPPQAVAVRFDRYGWVENIDYERLLGELPAGTWLRLETVAGRYAVQNSPLCYVFPEPADGLAARLRSCVTIGQSRTLQQDVVYGVRQLADVALKAMSPGINDPTTAHDAMSHLGVVLADLLHRDAPARRLEGVDGRLVLVPFATTPDELIGVAFDEVRIASQSQPTMLIHLLVVLKDVVESLPRTSRLVAKNALREQATLIRAIVEEADLMDADKERVRQVHARLFGS